VEVGVALAVLLAAVLHATWHALVKISGDRIVALAGMNVVSGMTAVAALPFVQLPTRAAFVVMALSVFLHGAYKMALAKLYGRAELSVGYPLARGLTPVIATLFAISLLNDRPGALEWLGIAGISAGVAALVLESRRPVSRSAIAAALMAGTAVAAYSVVDAYGIRKNDDWLGFTAWLVALDSFAFISFALLIRGNAALKDWRTQWERTLISGALGTVSFGVFMWALGQAAVGPVTALRETSVIFAALIGMLFLGERVTVLRLLASSAVLSGVAAIALGR
jgi:drug/metabolite transporter (DMT)-like permease